MILAYISSCLVLMPAVLAGIFYRYSLAKTFNLYLFGCLLTELLLYYTGRVGKSNWWIMYLFLIFEVLLIGLTFYKLVINKVLATLILYGTIALALLALVLAYMGSNYLMHHIQNTFLIIVSGAFLVDFISNDKSFELWRSAKLWIGIGVFFYFFSSALVFVLIEPMLSSSNANLSTIYFVMHSSINIVSYLIYSYAMICRK